MNKMKNICYMLFIAIIMVICLVPFACMTFARTDETTEKKDLAALPSLKTEAGFNIRYLGELGDYFEDHYAFRQYMVSLDSWMMSTLFQKSSVDNVIVGTNGWLFYKDSLNDYLGKDVLSDRAIYNIAYNIKTIQEKVESEGKTFVFTIAPNKNSLYGEYMPYTYSQIYDNENNRSRLTNVLDALDVSYVDLYQLFSAQDDILYLKKDSHWNNQGAMLAYNALLNAADWEHEDYGDCAVTVKKDYIGDLNSMVYPLLEQPEENQYYDYDTLYQYVNDGQTEDTVKSTVSVEDARVQTVNEEADGTLLMYRDSFGNTLLPLLANAFGNGYFYKTTPYNIDMHIEASDADIVMIEKVERKLDDLAYELAVMTGPDAELPDDTRTIQTSTTVYVVVPEINPSYYEILGVVDASVIQDDSEIYVSVETEKGVYKTVKAFAVSVENGTDFGYAAYISADDITLDTFTCRTYISRDDGIFRVNETDAETAAIQTVDSDTITDFYENKAEDSEMTADSDSSTITITIKADGTEQSLTTNDRTLQELTDDGTIKIDAKDRVIPALDDELLDGEVVSIQRVEIKTETETKEIPYETEQTTSSSIYVGETSVLTEGENGEETITYEATYVDGVLEKREKVSDEVTKEPVNEVIASGTKKHETATEAPQESAGETTQAPSKTIISKEWVEDCGSDSGYWLIIYSDGSYEIVE